MTEPNGPRNLFCEDMYGGTECSKREQGRGLSIAQRALCIVSECIIFSKRRPCFLTRGRDSIHIMTMAYYICTPSLGTCFLKRNDGSVQGRFEYFLWVPKWSCSMAVSDDCHPVEPVRQPGIHDS